MRLCGFFPRIVFRFLFQLISHDDKDKQFAAEVYCSDNAFHLDIDYAMLVKRHGAPTGESQTERKYSPNECNGTQKKIISGEPNKKFISTSYVERSNLSIRMGNRRFTRLTNAFSKKFENHCHSLFLYFTYYNFCKIHKSLSVTPAMQAGLMKKTNDLRRYC
jgi:hypothetical protein